MWNQNLHKKDGKSTDKFMMQIRPYSVRPKDGHIQQNFIAKRSVRPIKYNFYAQKNHVQYVGKQCGNIKNITVLQTYGEVKQLLDHWTFVVNADKTCWYLHIGNNTAYRLVFLQEKRKYEKFQASREFINFDTLHTHKRGNRWNYSCIAGNSTTKNLNRTTDSTDYGWTIFGTNSVTIKTTKQ